MLSYNSVDKLYLHLSIQLSVHPFIYHLKPFIHTIINVDFMFIETTLSDITMIMSSPNVLERSLPKETYKPMEDPVKHEQRHDNKLEDVTPSKKLGKYTKLKLLLILCINFNNYCNN